MGPSALALFALALAAASFWLGRRRALAAAGGRAATLQSLPGYYGWYAALWSGLPALIVLLGWLALSGGALNRLTLSSVPESARGRSPAELELLLHDARSAALGQASLRADDP